MIATIPRAQSLRFVDQYQYNNKPYTHDSLLLQDDLSESDEPIIYFQKYYALDNINVQCLTDYPTTTLKVYDCDDTLQQTVSLSDQNAGLDVTVLQGQINTYLLGAGIYYAKLVFSGYGISTKTFKSEYFEVGSYSLYPQIKWKTSDYAGIYYANGVSFNFRIEADIREYKPQSESDSFETYNSVAVNLKTTTKRGIILKTDQIPRYIVEKIVLAVAHQYFEVNGVEGTCLEGVETEKIPDTQMYMCTIPLLEKNYENYTQLTAASGGESPGTGVDTIIHEDEEGEEDNDIILDNTDTLLIPF
jgi:hypothetical protein